ncbi:MarR family transcriptional regulator [Arthrobacter deserti]|uniref:MarR family transcriptional regulator n=1 Tax=Arthrobacter deserti TaxID=1742687 RepID=A0ABX1JQ07_9MICC|nr:MarR family transcriptional regulator [Arthrobacter deserti]
MSVTPATASLLVQQIFDLQRTVRCAASAAARHTDLGPAVEGVLRVIAGADGCRASDVAARLGVGPSALSRQAADLEDHGLIVRRPDPADRRAQLLSLSDAGREYLASAEQRRTGSIRELLSGWDEDRARAAARTIEDLSAGLRAALEIPPRATKTGTTRTTSPQCSQE